MEAALPLGIIAGMLCIMGNAQYHIHKAAHGRVINSVLVLILILPLFFAQWIPFLSVSINDLYMLFVFFFVLQPKHIGNDMWDVAMERRDKKLVENFSAASH